VNATGFRAFAQQGILMTADQQLTLPVKLSVGSASQTVTVHGTGSLIDTQTGTIKTIIDQKSLRDLPVNGRNPVALVQLAQGVINITQTFNSSGQSSSLPDIPTYAVNGGRENTINYLVDGIDNNDPYTNVPAPYPDPDSLAEFSVQTSNFDAQYGRNSGGIVNAITKSGTNRLHGSAYEFIRDSTLGLDANDWGTNHYTPNAKEPFLMRHQFGGSLGGPVYIPHVYNGRNKSFFFVDDYQTIQHQKGSANSLTVPTPGQRGAASTNGCNGADLSYFLPGNQNPGDSRHFIVTDPATGLAFPNNCIPSGDLDPTALKFLNTYLPPAPNSTDPATPNTYAYPAPPDDTSQNELVVRGDQKLNQANHLMMRYYRYTYSTGEEGVIPNNIAVGRSGFLANLDNAALELTTVFTPHLVNLAYFGYSHVFSHPGAPPPGYPTSHSIGLGVFSIAPNPLAIGISGWTGADGTGGGSLPNDRNTLPLGDTLNYQFGRHALRFGGQVARIRQDYLYSSAYPNFSFNGGYSGNGLSDFLLGDFHQLVEGTVQDLNTRFTSWAAFAQDNWKVNDRLTLDLGLRWDPWIPPHFVGAFNAISEISDSAFAAGRVSTVFPNAPPGLLFYGDKGVPRGGTNAAWKNISPRIGFAYDLTGQQKWVLRGAYGVFYDQPKNDLYNRFLDGQPFNYTSFVNNGNGTTSPILKWEDPYNGQPDPIETFVNKGSNQGPDATFGTDIAGELSFESFHMPSIQSWNLSVEHQLPWNSLLRVSYVGNKGSHLEWTRDANTPIKATGPVGSWAPPDARRPLAPYFSYIHGLYWDGRSNYNGLQLSFEHRFSHGLSSTVNYVRSRAMDTNSDSMEFIYHGIQNPYNLSIEYGPAEFDVPNNFTASFVYLLPIPSTHNRVLDQVVRGWQINGIVVAHSEAPYSIFITEDREQNTENYQRAQLTGANRHVSSPTRTNWYNTNAYTDQYTALTDQNISGRDSGIRGPVYKNLDASASKNFAIKGFTTQFRVQAYNALNTPNLGINLGAQYPSSSVFGQLSTYSGGRVVEFAVHTSF
jgi:outer membrane receptor protein involved in Fe transport